MGVVDEVAECVELSEVIESERVIPPDDPDSDFVLSFNFLNILRLPKLLRILRRLQQNQFSFSHKWQKYRHECGYRGGR